MLNVQADQWRRDLEAVVTRCLLPSPKEIKVVLFTRQTAKK